MNLPTPSLSDSESAHERGVALLSEHMNKRKYGVYWALGIITAILFSYNRIILYQVSS